MTVCEETEIIRKEKHINSEPDVYVNFASRLDDGETLASGAQLIRRTSSAGVVTDLTVGTATIVGTYIKARVSEGSALVEKDTFRWETEFILEAQVVTSSGEKETELVSLVVYDCVSSSV